MALIQLPLDVARKPMIAALCALVVLCAMAVELTGTKKVPACCSYPRAAARDSTAGVDPAVAAIAAQPNQFEPIAPEDAIAINAGRPLADRPVQAPLPTYYPTAWDKVARDMARQCLATAVYYEAAGEGWKGEMAVAQVVLNRVRHPAYPKTVCGVVYQGSQLRTGCQFTFTCDGRLAHPPSPGGWKQAQAVADAALSGKVEASVGMSTHYHTLSVVPYWASSLDKLAVLGNHIFYTFAGAMGNRRAFSGHMAADDRVPLIASEPVAAELADAPVAGSATLAAATLTAVPQAAEAPRHLVADRVGVLEPKGGQLLKSDLARGELLAGAGSTLR